MKKLVLIAILLPAIPAFCQSTKPVKVIDLAEFVVQSTRLTPLEILDSILFYEPKNYLNAQAYSASISGTLISYGDTLFRAASNDVYFIRRSKRKPTYKVLIPKDCKSEIPINMLDSSTQQRINWSTGFPPTISFRDWIVSLKNLLRNNRVLFGTSTENGVRLHHILVQYYPQSGKQENWRFFQFIVDRNDWKLLRMDYHIFDRNDHFLEGIDSLKSCQETLQRIEAACVRPAAHFYRCSEEFRPMEESGKLAPYEYESADNLLFSTGDFTRTNPGQQSPSYHFNVRFLGVAVNHPTEFSMKDFSSIVWFPELAK